MILKNISKAPVVLPLGEYIRIDPGKTVDVKTKGKDETAKLKGFVSLSSGVLDMVKTTSRGPISGNRKIVDDDDDDDSNNDSDKEVPNAII